jgi:Fic family protein
VFLVKGAVATTAIEGNTLSEQEVMQHLDGTLRLPPSKEYLAQEVDNVLDVCDDILKRLTGGETGGLTPHAISDFNRSVLRKLSLPDEVKPGEIRTHDVTVGGYRGAPPRDCRVLLERLCTWLNGPDFDPSTQHKLAFGILKAVAAHLYLAWIHPFGDGNGRTARLMEFQILVAAGVPSPAAQLLSNHYNQTRQEYYRRLGLASAKEHGVLSFIEYAVNGFVDGLKEQLDTIRDQQWLVAWRDYVHERLSEQPRDQEVRRRRRNLVLDLSVMAQPVVAEQIRSISPRVAEAYARKTQRTLTRDLDALLEDELLVRSERGYSANRQLILAFLPPRRSP